MQLFNRIATGPKGNGKQRGTTLIELLIAVGLLLLVVLGFQSIHLFSNYHVINADRRAKLQNESVYTLQHMAKEISKAIGDISQSAVEISDISSDTAIKVYIDYNQNGQRDGGDRQIAYRFTGTTGSPSDRYQIWYYSNYVNPSSSYEVISRNVTLFEPTTTGNYVNVKITVCWDSDGNPVACGTQDNPGITMQSRIHMPGVTMH